MKKIALLLFVSLGINVLSQVSFGLNMSKNTTSAQFGYFYKRFNPYFSMQYVSVKASIDAKIQEIDPFSGMLATNSYDFSGKLSMTMPTIGLKTFLVERNKLKAFVNLAYSKPMLRANLDVGVPAIESEVERLVKDIKLNSLAFGVGAEYFIDQNFSVGAEFGFMSTAIKTSIDFTQDTYDPINDIFIQTTNTLGLKTVLSPTYARASLNFYFGK
jgi:hypothetical protein